MLRQIRQKRKKKTADSSCRDATLCATLVWAFAFGVAFSTPTTSCKQFTSHFLPRKSASVCCSTEGDGACEGFGTKCHSACLLWVVHLFCATLVWACAFRGNPPYSSAPRSLGRVPLELLLQLGLFAPAALSACFLFV